MRKLSSLAAVVLLLGFGVSSFLNGCSAQAQTQPVQDGRLTITTTTTMLYDLVSIIGGEQVEVRALMGPGIDPHLYQASAGDVIKMLEADVVVYNGLHLEGKMGEVFSSLKDQGRTVICIEDGIPPSLLLASEDNAKFHDPHIWFDVRIWKQAASHIAETLMEVDPENKDFYAAHLSLCLEEFDELETYIKGRVEELPAEQRVLISAHDAFGYFGNAYGFQVLGLQGISTDAEAGTFDVSSLANFIADNKIQAIFVESSVPPKNIEALQAAVKARGFEVAIGGELYSDSLGDADSGHDTYILTFKANVDTIVNALKW